MLHKVLRYIKKYNLIEDGDSVIVGLSGGADSVCLYLMLQQLQSKIEFQIRCVHVNHGMRGQEADEDELFVKNLCAKQGTPCSVYRYDVAHYASKHKISTEEAGRILRYESFEEERLKTNARIIAVAHNANDQAETVLLNLFRGSGLTGLSGIKPLRENIIRPILCLTRQEIETYCISNDILYRMDKTNLEDIYTRNKLRLHLLPYVEKEINMGVIEHINNTASLLSDEEDYLATKAKEACNYILKKNGNKISIDETRFKEEKKAIQRRVIRLAILALTDKLKNIDLNHIETVCSLFEKQVGKEIILPYNLIAKRTYEGILFQIDNSSIDKTDEMCYSIIPGQDTAIKDNIGVLETRIFMCEENVNIPKKTYTKWIDYDKIEGNLQLRTRKPGDFIVIKGANGSEGKKKLSDYFIDNKIPSEKRDKMLLLVEGQEVIWIAGYRISERYKISNLTKKILEVKLTGRYAVDVQEDI